MMFSANFIDSTLPTTLTSLCTIVCMINTREAYQPRHVMSQLRHNHISLVLITWKLRILALIVLL